ncbi:unnamed protein product [Macrosiphum euphorbiae]|uniref:Uncharacterized protein n=1 Tax=Macrosiphum euphorbiae TaxID=13131 RepID=A0AAV0X4A2_9HEMI|nr:unnamed protein product [Macrosiphum euphorbiae]
MKIQFNYVVSATVAFVFIVTSTNAKNVPQYAVPKNQSSPAKPSTRMLSSKTILLITPAVSDTMVASVNTIETTTIKVFVPVKNTMATTTVKGTNKNATSKKSIAGKAASQAVKIANVEKVTENQTDENRIMIRRYTDTNQQTAIIKPGNRKCKEGFIKTSSGYCKPIFRDE